MLQAVTPQAWVHEAARRWQDLLIDHANCEKKAASTALAFMFAYPEDRKLCIALARLAREELRHFEQVQKMMTRLGVATRRMSPGRYAAALRAELSHAEPQRKLDLLLCGALIEARSCERFEALAPALPEPLSGFYADLSAAEKRHQELYLSLARNFARDESTLTADLLAMRLTHLAQAEARLATEPDPDFRFHSGPPPEPT
jgi:tRNA 2-(methylsulfanyl)-N6-isopentenyladenosine37 hydroxylase